MSAPQDRQSLASADYVHRNSHNEYLRQVSPVQFLCVRDQDILIIFLKFNIGRLGGSTTTTKRKFPGFLLWQFGQYQTCEQSKVSRGMSDLEEEMLDLLSIAEGTLKASIRKKQYISHSQLDNN
jgi:hypothetical protein